MFGIFDSFSASVYEISRDYVSVQSVDAHQHLFIGLRSAMMSSRF